MTEDDLRALVRQAVARHLTAGDSGACLIEPSVKCNHCGFCQSHGF
jgi:hypothetical protein